MKQKQRNKMNNSSGSVNTKSGLENRDSKRKRIEAAKGN